MPFQDIGTEPCEHLCASGASLHPGEVNNFDALKREGHDRHFLTDTVSDSRE